MARKRGFEVTIKAFVECESSINDMSEAAVRIQSVEQHLMNLGFNWVDIESKFTSRKAPDPMPTLDDSRFATVSGTPDGILGLAPVKEPGSPTHPLDIPPELDRRVKG